jgi:hypothetical protein
MLSVYQFVKPIVLSPLASEANIGTQKLYRWIRHAEFRGLAPLSPGSSSVFPPELVVQVKPRGQFIVSVLPARENSFPMCAANT